MRALAGDRRNAKLKMAHILIWEFHAPAMRIAEFEEAYGVDGPWAALFRRAPGFLGTQLLRCTDQPGRYLTIDRWESEAAFDAFTRDFGAEYQALDKALEGLAAVENRIGAFAGCEDAGSAVRRPA